LKEISLHILDLAENSVNAGATEIQICVAENIKNDELVVNIKDNGCGMDAEKVKRITDPFVTSRTTRKVGLGIPFFKAAAEACEGSFEISSEVGHGTLVSVEFRHSHIDRMPLGDLKGTFLNLLIGNSDIRWIFRYEYNENVFEFDSQPVKEILGDLPLSDPQVIKFLRGSISEGIDQARVANTSLSLQERK
jgi:anti-sigma regulatory factor (Ser/Thr protein kinase)